MRGFCLYNYKVLIGGDREGPGRDTQGFLRGVFARISLIAGVSQLSWGKLLFIKRHFSCLHLLVQGPSKWAAKEWSDSAGRNAPGNTKGGGVWLTHIRTGIGTIWLQLTWLWEADMIQHLSWSSLKSALEVIVSKVMDSGTFCARKGSCECILLESSEFKLVFCGSLKCSCDPGQGGFYSCSVRTRKYLAILLLFASQQLFSDQNRCV